ncbi:MAG: 3-deoxy-D-manno-octulosonic acid transferase [Halanaerobiales bacterium]
MYIIYNIVLIILVLIYLPFIIFKIIKGEYKKNIKQRFGIIDEKIADKLKNHKVVWVHAVSVGETVAAEPIVSKFKEKHPEYKIVFSTVTETGQKMAQKIIKADQNIYFPIDFSFSVKKILNKIKPEAVVIMETELWPNFIKNAGKLGSKIMLANGRISDKSFKKYKYLKPLLKDMFRNINLFSMQSQKDKNYIIELGADKKKVVNTGNTKFDRDYTECDNEEKQKIFEEYKISSSQPVLVVGSTHPDEEKKLIPLYKELKAKFKDLVMILAPRHIKRTEEIEQMYNSENIPTIKRTNINDRKNESVILLNTIGELAQIYSIADLVFVGGSLIEKGGHNILEPVIQGKPVFFGPYMFNFQDNVRLIKEYRAGIQVKDVNELKEKLLYYFKNEKEKKKLSNNAFKMIEKNKGASEKNVEILLELLKK